MPLGVRDFLHPAVLENGMFRRALSRPVSALLAAAAAAVALAEKKYKQIIFSLGGVGHRKLVLVQPGVTEGATSTITLRGVCVALAHKRARTCACVVLTSMVLRLVDVSVGVQTQTFVVDFVLVQLVELALEKKGEKF